MTGISVYVFWNTGTLIGALLGTAIDPVTFGLDAAFPAAYVAMVWPQLRTPRGKIIETAFATGAAAKRGCPAIATASDRRLAAFRKALDTLLLDLAHQVEVLETILAGDGDLDRVRGRVAELGLIEHVEHCR